MVGVLQQLHQVGQLEDTFVLFTSDHGEMLGDHHLFRKTVPLESSAKVPFLVRPPRRLGGPRGVRDDRPVNLTDVMPTMLEEAGLPVPEAVEGRSLAPLLRGDNDPMA